MMKLDEPVNVGKTVIQNRLVMPPMQTNKTDHGHVTDELVAYYRDRALGSRPGIIITEHSYISANARASAGQLSIASDDMIAEHQLLTAAIHEGGCKTFVQLNHAGSNGIDEPVSAGNISIPVTKQVNPPRALSVDEIRAVEEQFAIAAVRSVSAGYDGVEIHCAHGYLLNQFYSPLTNKRTDSYGGPIENRVRFLAEVIACVRNAVGADVPVAVRLGGADYLPGGSTEEDAVQAAVMLEEAKVDLLDISGGMCFYSRPGHTEPGFFASMTEKIKAATTLPVLLTGGINTVADAERLLAEGKADLIGVGRALLRDADWRMNS